MTAVAGYIGAIVSIFGWGLCNVPMKMRRVRESGADPVVFMCYACFAIFSTSWLALAFDDFKYTPLGIAGAALWIPASTIAVYAIQYVGLSVAQGTWSGMAMLTSFIFGVALGDDPKNGGLVAVAFIVIVIGIAGVTLASRRFYFFSFPKAEELPAQATLPSPLDDPSTASTPSSLSPENSDLTDSDDEKKKEEETKETETQETEMKEVKLDLEKAAKTEDAPVSAFQRAKKALIGLLLAFLIGVLNGAMMVPSQFIPDDSQGVPYIVSFGCGCAVVMPVVATLYFGIVKREWPQFHFKQVAAPALLNGVLWNIANAGNVIATKNLGLTIGYPLTQISLLVSGLAGIIIFGEMPLPQMRAQFGLAAIILLGGAVLLALFG